MKKAFLVLTLLAFGTHTMADDESYWRIEGDDGSTVFNVMPTTARSYVNAGGGTQVEALVHMVGKTSKGKKYVDRSRWVVTGCQAQTGQLSWLNPDGTVDETRFEWAVEGDRLYDELAWRICIAQARKEAAKNAKRAASWEDAPIVDSQVTSWPR
jgi:hypothetical protein